MENSNRYEKFSIEALLQRLAGSAYISTQQTETDPVSDKIPEFIVDEPEIWFILLDYHFLQADITSDAGKFGRAVMALPARFFMEIKEVLSNSPTSNQFETLRTYMLEQHETSRKCRISQQLEFEEIGDRKPSQYLRYLRDVANDQISDEVLKVFWLSKLPKFMRSALLGRPESSLNQIANIADTIQDAIDNMTTTSSVKTNYIADLSLAQDKTMDSPTLNQIQQSLGSLIFAVHELQIEQTSFKESIAGLTSQVARSRSPSRSRDSRQHLELCWYHWIYGSYAHRCKAPCSWTQ